MMSWIASVCVSFMHNPYLNPACIICRACKQPAVDGQSIAAVTNKKKLKCCCMFKLELSLLRLPMLHSGNRPALPFTYWGYLLSARGRSIFRKYLNAHLKFTVYGCKHVRSYVTNTLLQGSPASVWLAQAHPNNLVVMKQMEVQN